MIVRRVELAVAVLAFFCSALWVGQFASAAAIVGSMHEPFNYAAATLFPTPSTLNGGAGWNAAGAGAASDNVAASLWNAANSGGAAAGTFRTATEPGLTYTATGYLPASGSRLTLDAATPNANQNVGRNFGGQSIDSGTTYFSVLMSRNTLDTFRTINLAFFNGTTERFAIGQFGAAAGNTGGNLGLLMNNQNPAGIIQRDVNNNPIAMGNGVTHLLLGRIDWNAGGNETVSLWVDPSDVTTEALAGPVYLATSGFELTAITGIRPFVGNNVAAGTSNPAMPGVSANFDEFRLGGTWESVTSLPVPVPEPTTLLLAGLGAVGLTMSMWRRKAA